MAREAAAAGVNGRLTEVELEAAGQRLGRELAPGAILWLEGDLGAGKTTLARAIARGRGVRDNATSPTYDLVHRYEGTHGAIYHVDCYRLRHPAEAAELDWATMASGDLLMIEWPARAGEWAWPPTLRIGLAHDDDPSGRVVTTR